MAKGDEHESTICLVCQDYLRLEAAQSQLRRLKTDALVPWRYTLQPTFAALQQSASEGCRFCTCWRQALVDQCFSSTALTELQSSNEPVVLSFPTAASKLTESDHALFDWDNINQELFTITCVVQTDLCFTDPNFCLPAVERDPRSPALFTKIDNWLKNCYKAGAHPKCAGFEKKDILPRRLLDVRSRRPKLVDSSSLSKAKYMALSYCWGAGQAVKLTSSSEERFKDGVDLESMVQTLQDAVFVCRQLKVDYLWVDALCILQDDHGQDWETETRNMHNVFGNAWFTLCVCSAVDASHGFLSERWPKDVPMKANKAGGYFHYLPAAAPKSLAHIRNSSALASRGWVFQEELLSPRIIYWSNHGVFWSCLSSTQAENVRTNTNIKTFPRALVAAKVEVFDPHAFLKRDDPLFLWEDMVTSYSTRGFTIKSDRLPALSGLATIVQGKTGDEYLCGMWRSRLPAQLLWIDITKPTQDKQRQSLDLQRQTDVPSWTWSSLAHSRVVRMAKQTVSRAQLLSITNTDSIACLHLRSRMKALDQAKLDIGEGKEFDIHYDNGTSIDSGRLFCFEINYQGFVLLEHTPHDDRYRRISCVFPHFYPRLFHDVQEVDIRLV